MRKNPYGILSFIVFLLAMLLPFIAPQEGMTHILLGLPTSIILGIIYYIKNKKDNNLETKKSSLSGILGLMGITLSIFVILGLLLGILFLSGFS